MFMRAFAVSVAAVILLAAVPASAREMRNGTWTAEMRKDGLHFELWPGKDGVTSRSSMPTIGLTEPLSRFENFAPSENARFSLRGDAGTLLFEGRFVEGAGSGHFTFTPDAGYVEQMAQLGFRNLRDSQLIVFASEGLPIQTLRDLRSMGHLVKPSELDDIAVFHVTPAAIREFAALGLQNLTIRNVVSLRVGDVDTAYVRDLRALGFTDVNAHDIGQSAILGVTPEYIRQLRAAGVSGVSLRELRDLRVGKITAQKIEEFRVAGYPKLSARDLAAFGIHDVTAEYIESLRNAGYANIPARQLVEMRIHHVTPEYIRKMNGAGVRDLRKVIDSRANGDDDVKARKNP